MTPFDKAVNESMLRLAEHPRALFVGQSVAYDGAKIYGSLEGVPMEKRLELPVLEDFQMGFCMGLALQGYLPICIYPRMDFMVLALNQLVNHLDKAPLFGWHPKVIIRVGVGQKHPLDAGPQHTNDHTEAFRQMLTSIPVVRVGSPVEVTAAYESALAGKGSVVIVEHPSFYDGWDAFS